MLRLALPSHSTTTQCSFNNTGSVGKARPYGKSGLESLTQSRVWVHRKPVQSRVLVIETGNGFQNRTANNFRFSSSFQNRTKLSAFKTGNFRSSKRLPEIFLVENCIKYNIISPVDFQGMQKDHHIVSNLNFYCYFYIATGRWFLGLCTHSSNWPFSLYGVSLGIEM